MVRPRLDHDKGADKLHAIRDVNHRSEDQPMEVGPEQRAQGGACGYKQVWAQIYRRGVVSSAIESCMRYC